MVGTTGTGKTTTLNIYTGNDLPTGVCAQSITEETVAVKDKIHPDGPKWIDTPGKVFCSHFLGFLLDKLPSLGKNKTKVQSVQLG